MLQSHWAIGAPTTTFLSLNKQKLALLRVLHTLKPKQQFSAIEKECTHNNLPQKVDGQHKKRNQKRKSFRFVHSISLTIKVSGSVQLELL